MRSQINHFLKTPISLLIRGWNIAGTSSSAMTVVHARSNASLSKLCERLANNAEPEIIEAVRVLGTGTDSPKATSPAGTSDGRAKR
ncbi:MAG: hypothetical protein JSW59_08470 [Phycisphaerales bacterium]|nr:MAG: hypothetical protein JSW59_08470 [Phycisphaerales bacterium]